MGLFAMVLPFLTGLIVVTTIVKYSWSYLMPRLFPAAVEQNYISEEISWNIALVLGILLMLI